MEWFFKAEQGLKEKKFRMAYGYYLRSLESEKSDQQALLTCCRKIVELGQRLEIRWDGREEELLARAFFSLGRYGDTVKYGEDAICNKKSQELYELLWEAHFHRGNLLRAGEIAEDYLLHCKRKHLCDSGLNFIKNLEGMGLGGESFEGIAMELEICRGNRKVVLGRLEQLERLCGGTVPPAVIGEMERYKECVDQEKEYWEREGVVRRVFLKCGKERLSKGRILTSDMTERNRIIRLALVDFLLGGDDFLGTLKSYALAFEKVALMKSLNEYESKKCSTPENLHPKEMEDESVLVDGRENILDESKGMEDILDQIHFLSSSSGKGKDSKIDIFLDGLSECFLIENAENLLVCLMEMNLHESALRFFDRLREQIKDQRVEYQINMAYMELIALKKSKKYYRAMDLIHDILASLPVNQEERGVFIKERESLLEEIRSSKEGT